VLFGCGRILSIDIVYKNQHNFNVNLFLYNFREVANSAFELTFQNPTSNNFNIEIIVPSSITSWPLYHAVAFASEGIMKDAEVYFCTDSGIKAGTIQRRWAPPSQQSALPASVDVLLVTALSL